jgi:predicted acetyltransferase
MSRPSVRPARHDDLARLVAIHTAAFPDERTAAVRQRNFEHNRFGSFDHLRVVEDRGIVVGHAFLFPFEIFFGGRPVKTAGIASVGVAPEARGRGIARALIGALEDEARQRGDVLAMLHPFRQSFYAELGYAPVTPLTQYRTSARAIPEEWIRAARTAPLTAASGADAIEMESAYRRYAARTTGLLDRPSSLWDRKRLLERRHEIVVKDGSSVRGYVAFVHEQDEPHADVTLVVEEIVADDDETRRVLFGVLGAQRDQVRTIVFVAPASEPTILSFEDADRDESGTEACEHPLGIVMAGPMVKLLDRAAALSARGYPREPVDVHERVAKLSDRAVASIFFGAVPARDAVRLGWVASPEAAAAIDALAALPPFEVVDAF